jgi:phycocyanobilin lyase beta subunit
MMITETIASQIRAVAQADSPEQLLEAVQALVASHSTEGIATLIQVLGYNNPAAAVVAVGGLIQLAEASVLPLLQSLDEYNYGARAYAIRALAAIADPRALEVLVTAAETDFAPSVRRAATKGLGQIRWQADVSVASAQQRVLQSLMTIAHDADWSLRYAAIVGLQALATAAVDLIPAIVDQCRLIETSDGDAVVQARATLALSTLSP